MNHYYYFILQGLVKPDIVFFGEDLPSRFHTLQRKDFRSCDLLIVMGTSLEVCTVSIVTVVFMYIRMVCAVYLVALSTSNSCQI